MTNPAALERARALEAAGNLEAALRAWMELGKKGEAGRVAFLLRRYAESAKLYADAGFPFEAAGAYYQAGDLAGAIDQLAYVPKDHARWREACVHAIHIAARADRFDFGVENLLTGFVALAPKDGDELAALLVLAGLYEKNGFPENAQEALGRVLAVDPVNVEALALSAKLSAQTRPAPADLEKAMLDDAAFRAKSRTRAAAAPSPALAAPFGAESARSTVIEVGIPPPAGAAAPLAGPPTSRPPSPAPAAAAVSMSAPAPSAAPAAVAPGAPAPAPVFANRFRLNKRIGVGGMAEVWQATDLDVGEEIALKIFQPLADPSAEDRIKAELKLTRRLAHPNVVRIFDIGMHENRRYISMEYLQGRDLQQVPKPVTPAQAVDWMVQACEGLGLAHETGVIHRDVKPENLFLTEAGRVKVMDFGIAKDSEVRRTRAGMMAGTPEFMSPEQINDMSQVSPATDLYALGVVAYELLTGTIPFTHKELMPLLMMHVNDPPPPMRSRRPELPEALDRAVLKALEKRPENRWPSAKAFAEALRAAIAT